jgi:hypothetical protein
LAFLSGGNNPKEFQPKKKTTTTTKFVEKYSLILTWDGGA